MLNEKELNISNKSYTNKDFGAIYPELVDFITNITNRYNPKTSNESDPGVVLTKEMGFMGDKLNYNIDKNILEVFMPSCTQETSMRQNCESRGYEMSYYNSATTKITFTYNGTIDENTTYSLPAFSTVVSSSDDDVYYVTTEKVEFSKDSLSTSVACIEGELVSLTVANASDETLIQLSNLDDNRRIYFPVKNVAQNGVYISNELASKWSISSNLNLEELGKACYKFGYDSRKGLPYVEFPRDIANLIDSGLRISYIETRGKDGNVQANYLTKLAKSNATKIVDNAESTWDIAGLDSEDPEIYIKNESASINGSDIETIDEAYNNYSKTVGVFDTLVTCRDYENAIYNIYKEEYPVVSNVHVADRRDDVNYSTRFLSYDEDGLRYMNYTPVNGATAYDLCLYPLNPINTYSLEAYYESFKPLPSTSYIEDRLENSKCISHDYITSNGSKHFSDDDIYAIKNYAKLNARIVTTYKVNNYERAQILQNVQQALIENFNARKVNYGSEIPYDIILDVIQNADSRISSVSLSEPELTTYYMTKDGDEIPQVSQTGMEDYFTTVVARNVLNGKVSLLNFDDEFNFDLGQTSVGTLSELKEISSSTGITNVSTYKLKQNEVIQLVGPSLLTSLSYTAYVYYRFVPENHSTTVSSGQNYKLRGEDKLYIYYTDSDKMAQAITYTAKDNLIIQPMNITLVFTENQQGGGRTSKVVNGETIWYNSLGANDSIDIKELNATRLDTLTNCYWLRNNSDNDLFASASYNASQSSANLDDANAILSVTLDVDDMVEALGSAGVYTFTYDATTEKFMYGTIDLETDCGATYSVSGGNLTNGDTVTIVLSRNIILEDNEYFFYTDSGFNTLVTVGSGTTISTTMPNTFDWKSKKVLMSDIVENGLLALREYWKRINYNQNAYLDLQENSIVTLIENDEIQLPSAIDITNSLQDIGNGEGVYYTINGSSSKPLEKYDVEGMTWKIKSRLDIVASKDKAQELVGNQVVIFKDKSNNTLTASASNHHLFNLNLDTDLAGASVIDVTTLDGSGNTTWPLSAYVFTQSNDVIIRDSEGMLLVSMTSGNSITYNLPSITNKESLLMIYWEPSDSSTLSVAIDSGTLKFYPNVTYSAITSKEMHVLRIPKTATTITFSSTSNGDLILSTPRYFKNYNPQLGIETLADEVDVVSTTAYDNLETKISNASNGKFYYSLYVDNANAIEVDDLSSPYALYDYNNVANKCTITMIDIENSDIDITRSSRT